MKGEKEIDKINDEKDILNKVFNMDCLEFMEKIPNKYFDLIITDPPYGLDIHSKNQTRGKLAKAKDYGVIQWDKSIPSKEYFDEIIRISKNQIIFGGNYMTAFLKPSSCWVVWDKDNGSNDFADCELAWTSFNSAVRKFKYRWNGMLQERMNWKEKRQHPTQKPVELGRWLLKKYAKDGDIVFDPFAGSGSFLLACKQLGFNYCGCELDKDYIKIIHNRMKQLTFNDLEKNLKGKK